METLGRYGEAERLLGQLSGQGDRKATERLEELRKRRAALPAPEHPDLVAAGTPPIPQPRQGQVLTASRPEARVQAAALLRATRRELDAVVSEYRYNLTEVYSLQMMPGWTGAQRLYEETRWEVGDWDIQPTTLEQTRFALGYRWDFRTTNRVTYYLVLTVSAQGVVELRGSGPDVRKTLPATAEGFRSFIESIGA
ncbi:hypothetical protein ACIRVF_41465 [Kitasatospora sp. NPDC101157]|uniref:hypothetical protein n=1 Tax=Kitasatospora sp. NPDC101157 TaxID=3364098 RepID=UPI003813EF7E